ncbi:MAG: ComEA family DNA-binding protein [Candidatus Eremiobacteraeota bacterium]|nr:ComEA family DNA-binding protein [Candidatus Eremiobacteraeota bacterium]
MKRYAGAAAIGGIVLALLFHSKPAEHAIVQSDAVVPHFQMRVHQPLARQLVVYVTGAVVRPGLYHLHAGARGVDAIRMAGGLTAQADPAGVNLAEQLEDGEQLTAPRIGERVVATHRTRVRRSAHRRRKRDVAAPVSAVNLNSADVQTLMQLPGIGAQLAQRIIAFREANGPFASVDELADVSGVTPRILDTLAPYLMIAR